MEEGPLVTSGCLGFFVVVYFFLLRSSFIQSSALGDLLAGGFGCSNGPRSWLFLGSEWKTARSVSEAICKLASHSSAPLPHFSGILKAKLGI